MPNSLLISIFTVLSTFACWRLCACVRNLFYSPLAERSVAFGSLAGSMYLPCTVIQFALLFDFCVELLVVLTCSNYGVLCQLESGGEQQWAPKLALRCCGCSVHC